MLPSRLERWFNRTFGDVDARHLGSGWVSGILAVFLGSARRRRRAGVAVSRLAVVC